jgi:hypothetical protein
MLPQQSLERHRTTTNTPLLKIARIDVAAPDTTVRGDGSDKADSMLFSPPVERPVSPPAAADTACQPSAGPSPLPLAATTTVPPLEAEQALGPAQNVPDTAAELPTGAAEPALQPSTDDDGGSTEIAADEQQFLSFLAGLAAEPDATAAAAPVEQEGPDEGGGDDADGGGQELPSRDEPPRVASEQQRPPPLAAAVPEPTRRSSRAPKPKRPREAPGVDDDDAAAARRRLRQQQSSSTSSAAPTKKTKQTIAAAQQDDSTSSAKVKPPRKVLRIRLTSSSIGAAKKAAAAKATAKRRPETADAGSPCRTAEVPAKRPRVRLSSSSVQQAYDAAAAIKERLGAEKADPGDDNDDDDDDDDIPLFSIRNKERQKKHATPEEVLSELQVGSAIKVKDKGGQGWPGRVVRLDPVRLRVLVHFVGWNSRYDRWVRAKWSRIALVEEGSRTASTKQPQSKPDGSGAADGGVTGGDDATLAHAAAASLRHPTPHTVRWACTSAPARPIRLRTHWGGFLAPRACHPVRLAGAAGLRFDLLSGGARVMMQGGVAGRQLLERYRRLVERGSAGGGGGESLADGSHAPMLPCGSAVAKTASALVLRVGARLVGAATFRLHHPGGEAGEASADSTLVMEVLGLAVAGDEPPTVVPAPGAAAELNSSPQEVALLSRRSRRREAPRSPFDAFGSWLVAGLKALAWAEAEQLGVPRRQASRAGGGGSSGLSGATAATAGHGRRATRSRGSRRCYICARASGADAVAFWQAQQLRPGAEADAVVSYVAAATGGKSSAAHHHQPSSSSAAAVDGAPAVPVLCRLEPDGSDARKPPPSATVELAALAEAHAARTIQKAVRRVWAARARAALEAARRQAEEARRRAAEEAARRQAEQDAEEIEEVVDGVVRCVIGRAAAAKAKARREAKVKARVAALAKSRATREANAAARRQAAAQLAAELRAWQDGLQVGAWCVDDETGRAGQLDAPPNRSSGVVEVRWADGQEDGHDV